MKSLLLLLLVSCSGDRDLSTLKAVETWLLKEQDTDLSKVEVVEVSDGNFGLVLRSDLGPGQRAVQIPRSACISQRDADVTTDVPAAVKVAAKLYAEFFVRSNPFVRALRLVRIDAPVGWSDDEAQMIAGTRAFEARRKLLQDWYREADNLDLDPVLYSTCRALVASRAYDLPEGIGPVLIPFLDLANHDDTNFLALDVDLVDDRVVFALVNENNNVLPKGSTVAANYCGGRPIDPAQAIDIFGWLHVKAFCQLRPPNTEEIFYYRPGDDLPPSWTTSVEHSVFLYERATRALQELEDLAPTRAAAADIAGACSNNIEPFATRRALATDIVDGERAAWTALLAHLDSLHTA